MIHCGLPWIDNLQKLLDISFIMSTLLIYLVLFNFWLEASLHVELEQLFGLSMGMSLKNISLYLLLISSIFAIKSQKSFIFRNNINKCMTLFGFVILISMLIETVYYSGLGNVSEFKILKKQIIYFKNFINPWMFFILISIIIKKKNTCKYALLGIIVFGFLTSITGIVDQNTTINLGTTRHTIAYEGRYFGFSEANQYATFLVLTLPLVLSYSLFNKNKKLFFLIIFMTGFIALISTVSKGGFIGFLIAAFAFTILSVKNTLIGSFRVAIFLIVLIPILAVTTFVTISSDVKKTIKYKVIDKAKNENNYNPWQKEHHSIIHVYTSGRSSRWLKAFNLFIESPIWGKGNYTLREVIDLDPHNDYLNILIKYGIIGFLLYLLIYINILRTILKKLKSSNDEEQKIILIGYLSGFIGYMVCMFGAQLIEPRYIFWIYTAIVIKYIYLDSKDEEKPKIESKKERSFI